MVILRWIIALPLIIGAVLFAWTNPQTITLTYSPFHDPTDMPLYVIVLLFLGLGFLIGAFMAWIGMSPVRKDRRQQKKIIRQLEKELVDKDEELMRALDKKPTSRPTDLTPIESDDNL